MLDTSLRSLKGPNLQEAHSSAAAEHGNAYLRAQLREHAPQARRERVLCVPPPTLHTCSIHLRHTAAMRVRCAADVWAVMGVL